MLQLHGSSTGYNKCAANCIIMPSLSVKYFLLILLRNWTTGKTNSVEVRAFPAPTELTVKSPISFSELIENK